MKTEPIFIVVDLFCGAAIKLLPWNDSIEVWKEIPGFPKYEVSNFSNVRFKTTKRHIKQRLSFGDKYLKVSLGAGKAGKTIPKRVHRLVASAFCYKPEGKSHVNHDDGNRLNNNWKNLVWATQQENNHHSFYVLGNKSPMLSAKGKAPANKLFNKEILDICIAMFDKGISTETIGKTINVNGSTVRKHLRKHFQSTLLKQKAA